MKQIVLKLVTLLNDELEKQQASGNQDCEMKMN